MVLTFLTFKIAILCQQVLGLCQSLATQEYKRRIVVIKFHEMHKQCNVRALIQNGIDIESVTLYRRVEERE